MRARLEAVPPRRRRARVAERVGTAIAAHDRERHRGADLEVEPADAQAVRADQRRGEHVVDAVAVRAVVDGQLAFLSVALRNIVNTFNPARVILGGFLATLEVVGGASLDTAVRSTALPGPATDVQLVASELGRDNLLIGAAELAFASVLQDPAGFGSSSEGGRNAASA